MMMKYFAIKPQEIGFISLFLLSVLFLMTQSVQLISQDSAPKWESGDCAIEWDAEKHTGIIPLSIEKMTLNAKGLPTEGKISIGIDSLMDNDIEYDLMQKVLENTLKSEEWFNTAVYPNGYFEIISFTASDNPDIYHTKGKLTIKDKTNDLSFYSIVHREGNNIHIQSECIGFNRILWAITTWSASTATGDEEMIVSDIFNIEVNLRYTIKP
jgi:hypothetical protein